jgi:cysteinyl-tRNA synthetase
MSKNPLSPEELVDASRAGRPALLSLVGNTPLVPMNRLNPNPRVRLLAKLECFNPGGSVKDRVALSMIEHAERTGELTRGKTILEATSGNTGIGLAMVAAVKGYPILLAMSEGVSLERRKILSALGAELLLTPAELATDGAIEAAYELAGREPERYFITDQYNNEANILAHYDGTGPEVWAQTDHAITHFVATMGTTGTLMGASRRLRELNPAIEIIGVEPYLGHHIQGLKNMKESYHPGIYDLGALSAKVNVDDDAAYEMSRRIAREEGILVGMSAGAAMHVAVEKARELEGGVMVVVIPDGGERYLSTVLFQVPAEVGEPEAEATSLRFLNSFTRRNEVFKPLDPRQVTMYTCGPTVHTLPHLGLYRRIMVADLVRRTVELAGFRVKHAMNLTDLDDRTLKAAEAAGLPLPQLTGRVTQQFMEDLQTLGIKAASEYPRASDYVEAMVDLTGKLVKSGHAYERYHSVYFNIGKFGDYGALSGVDLDKIHLGATVDLDSYEKGDPRDFTLLKRSSLDEIKKGVSFSTEFGKVRPGWHIECAVMAMSLLGEQADIHVGGVDLLFPHHENEIAICQSVTGKRPANYWIHSGLVMVEGRKMSRSAGNAVSVRDLLERGYTGRQIRLFVLSTHYRQPLRFSFEALDASCGSLKRLDECVRKLRQLSGADSHPDAALLASELEAGFREALFEDLNVSAAIAALFNMVRRINRRLDRGQIGEPDARLLLEALGRADTVLAVLPPRDEEELDEAVAAMIQQREAARRAQDYETADRLRAAIEEHGIVLEDTPQGLRWRRR